MNPDASPEALEAGLSEATGSRRRELQIQLAWTLLDSDLKRANELAREALEDWDEGDSDAAKAAGIHVACAALILEGQHAEARGMATEALSLLGGDGDVLVSCRLHDQLARCDSVLGDRESALHNAATAVALVQKGDLAAEQPKVSLTLGGILARRGDNAGAEASYQDALDTSPPTGVALKAEALCGLGVVAQRRGRLSTAQDFFEQSLTFAKEAEDDNLIARPHMYLSALHKSLGRFVLARAHFRPALDRVRLGGNRMGLAAILSNGAELERTLGDFDAAVELGQEARDVFESMRSREGVASALRLLATVSYEKGELDKAEEHYLEAIEVLGQSPDARLIALSMIGLGAVDRALGSHDTAAAHYAEASRSLEQSDARVDFAIALLGLGSVQLDAGEAKEGLATLQRALAVCKALETQHTLSLIRWELVRAYTETGDRGAAEKERAEATKLDDLIAAARDYGGDAMSSTDEA